jgi:RHS repeat-associated protein
VTTTYLVDDQNPTGYAQVVYESTTGSSAPNREVSHTFTYGLERTLEQRVYLSGGNFFTQTIYFVYDGHGSVRALTDQTGAVTDTYDYDAFGNLLHSTGTTLNNYRFAGEQFDPDLNLYFNRARYLNTSTGRFWNMDSFEGDQFAPVSLHKYLYASADPVDRIDPNGHEDIASLSVSEGISEELDSSQAEADFTAKKALNLKVVDIYSCSKLQAYIIPIHCWVYANQPGNEGLRYDIGAVPSERGPGLIIGSVSGTLEITPTTLARVKADANLSFTKQASLSELGFLEWSAAIISEFEFLGLIDEGVKQYSVNYSFNTVTNDAVNCVTFTGFAILAAKRIAASAQ